jgi:hypothetical protein
MTSSKTGKAEQQVLPSSVRLVVAVNPEILQSAIIIVN